MTSSLVKKRVRVRIDPIRCTAFGFCAEFCPEMFTLDEWGYAWLHTSEAGRKMVDTVYETARLCPRGAILVEDIDESRAPRRLERMTLRKS